MDIYFFDTSLNDEICSRETECINIELLVFPWAIIKTPEKSLALNLLSNEKRKITEESLRESIENLEYSFSNALVTLQRERRRRIELITHHHETGPLLIADLIKRLSEKYEVQPYFPVDKKEFTLEDLEALEKFDALMIIKPQKSFSENDKFIIDQYIMKGGKTLWLLESTKTEMETLRKEGKLIALPIGLNLTNLLFKYGVRLQPSLVKDPQGAPISITSKADHKFESYHHYSIC